MKLRRGCRLWWLVLPVLGLDRLLKMIAAARLAPSGVKVAVPGVLSWAYMENSGTAFSMLSDRAPWLLIALTGALLVALIVYQLLRPGNSTPERVGLWLLIGGGLGNLWDRLVYGRVIDFIRLDFVHFAVFNPADIFVCVGVALIALSLILGERRREHE